MLTINPKKPTYKEVLQTLKIEVKRSVHIGAVKVMPNGKLKCKSLAWLAREFVSLYMELTPKQQTKLLNVLGGINLQNALEVYAVKVVGAILNKQQRTMHPAKYALMLEVYKYAHKRTFSSYKFYKQAKGVYKLHCFMQEQTANKICQVYNKKHKVLGYIATPRKRKGGSLYSEYYHIVLVPKQ